MPLQELVRFHLSFKTSVELEVCKVKSSAHTSQLYLYNQVYSGREVQQRQDNLFQIAIISGVLSFYCIQEFTIEKDPY